MPDEPVEHAPGPQAIGTIYPQIFTVLPIAAVLYAAKERSSDRHFFQRLIGIVRMEHGNDRDALAGTLYLFGNSDYEVYNDMAETLG